MTPTPEPAVGQVWIVNGILHQIHCISEKYPGCYSRKGSADWYELAYLADATYLGTLDELREHQALKRDAELWRTQVRTDNTKVIANLEAKVHQLEVALNRILVTNATWRGTPDFADAMSSALRKAGAALGDTKAGEDEAKAELALRAENAKLRTALKAIYESPIPYDGMGGHAPMKRIAQQALTPSPHE